jgi:hypothetical protein
MQRNKLIAVFVKKNLLGLDIPHIYVAQNVSEPGQINGIENGINGSQNSLQTAYIVEKNSQQNALFAKDIIEQHAQVPAQEDLDMKKVYNLKVEPYGVYYANGILVSNCDTAADAIKIALIDKAIISAHVNVVDYTKMAQELTGHQFKINRLRQNAYKR